MAEPTIDAEPPPFDPEIRAALETCMEHQVAGRLDEARAIADEVLGQSPDDVDALHLSGLIRFAQGEASEGVALVRRALELSPRFMVARGNLAVMLRQTNR